MFKAETVAKLYQLLNEKIAFYSKMEAEDIKMSISTGNMKIGHTLNVSLAPLVTCGNCSECSRYCYDVKACFAYPSCLDARARNTAIFRKNRDLFFNRLHKRMDGRRKNKFLRFHVSGEIVDVDHFKRIVETAKKYPDWTIWMYTKMYWLVNAYVKQNGGSKAEAIPGNLQVMFSEWRGLPMINPYGFPVFKCVFESEGEKAPAGWFHCPGNCNYCKQHNSGCVSGKNTWVTDH